MAFRDLTKLAIIVWSCLTVISACDPGPQSRQNRHREQLRIVMVGESQKDPTWPILQSMAAEFERLYPFATVQTLAPQSGAPHEQQTLLEGLLEESVHAICVAPNDPLAIQSIINRLAGSGRPVVTIGMDVPSSSRAVFCGPAEMEIGRSAAVACGSVLTGRSRTVMVLHAGTDHDVYRGRYFSFKEKLPDQGRIQLMGEVDCRGNSLEAARLVRKRVRMYPRVGCWVFLDDWALQGLKPGDRLLPLGCALVLCNGSPEYLEDIRKGEIQALVAFDYYQAVQDALHTALRLGQGGELKTNTIIATPAEIKKKKNVDEYDRRWKAWQQGKPSPNETLRE